LTRITRIESSGSILLPELVDRTVATDGNQPGHRIGSPIETISMADRSDERLLGEVFAGGRSPPHRPNRYA
jgi:hypothetical protein